MSARLTDLQRSVLRLTAKDFGVTKDEVRGRVWRTIDALERRGLCSRGGDAYFITPVGRTALAQEGE